MCQVEFYSGPHAGKTSTACRAIFCNDPRHHWLRIKRLNGPLSVGEKAELLRYDKHVNTLMEEALEELASEGTGK